jgi:hypothetical protein
VHERTKDLLKGFMSKYFVNKEIDKRSLAGIFL